MGSVRFALVVALAALTPALVSAYTLGPGDQVSIDVSAAQTQLSLEALVSVDGRIYIAPAGAFVAEGKTPAELESQIARAMENYLVGPVQVTVLVRGMKMVKVSVLGQVRQPGQYSLADDRPLLSQAVGAAGGLSAQAAARRVSLTRDGRDMGPVDLYAILRLGRGEQDVELRPDDVIYVPAREAWVTVLGPVQEPAIYELLPGDRLSDLVRMAGGLAAGADQRRAVIERLGEAGQARTLDADLAAALARPDGAADLELAAGDVVRVASRVNQIYVLGEVTEPGAKPFDDNRSLLDYIGIAGGATHRATTRKVVVVRAGNPEPTVIPVDLTALAAGEATTPPPRLQPGDIIFVPERRIATVQDWTSIAQVIATFVAGTRIF